MEHSEKLRIWKARFSHIAFEIADIKEISYGPAADLFGDAIRGAAKKQRVAKDLIKNKIISMSNLEFCRFAKELTETIEEIDCD